MSNKFVSNTILTAQDGLHYTEIRRDEPIQVQEKKLTFMTLSEQVVEQEKLDQLLRPEVTKMQRKKQTKPNIYEKTKPLSDEDNLEYVEESGFKQEIFNEEDFDYFQYYGQLREIEDRKMKIEKEHIRQFKQKRSELIVDGTPQIIVMKEGEIEKKTGPLIKFKKKTFKEDEALEQKTETEPAIQKKIQTQLVSYDSDS